MKYNIVIGGKAGQGINKISEIISKVITSQGYFVFNYRDYPSLIRGGHNFNVLTISDKRIGSNESKIDTIIAMDENTIKVHEKDLKKSEDPWIFNGKDFEELGRDMNIALASAYLKVIGVPKQVILDEIKTQFKHQGAINAVEKGYDSEDQEHKSPSINRKINIMTGTQAVAQGAINSKLDLCVAYPMTPATGVLHELAGKAKDYGFQVFQPENEIAVVNAGIGASFAGAKTMVGTSGGGYDLMTEGLSFQGQSEIPLVCYLCSRPGPGTGVPTYTSQADLDIALRGGHGEFPRVVIAPGDPIECIEKTNEAFYLAEKFNTLSIILSDKHLAESEFSSDRKPNKILPINITRKLPGQSIVKASSYECDKFGNTTESALITKQNADKRLAKYEKISEEVKKFEMIKIFGKKNSKNLIIGWGSTKTVILDTIEGEDFKFLQVLYMKPLSDEIEKEIKKADKVIIVENNVTGQLGRLLREKTGIIIKNRILKYDGRAFNSDELKEELQKIK
jgi:2-oxoglutarate ferredoxin oxidoreductase subunit alpha